MCDYFFPQEIIEEIFSYLEFCKVSSLSIYHHKKSELDRHNYYESLEIGAICGAVVRNVLGPLKYRVEKENISEDILRAIFESASDFYSKRTEEIDVECLKILAPLMDKYMFYECYSSGIDELIEMVESYHGYPEVFDILKYGCSDQKLINRIMINNLDYTEMFSRNPNYGDIDAEARGLFTEGMIETVKHHPKLLEVAISNKIKIFLQVQLTFDIDLSNKIKSLLNIDRKDKEEILLELVQSGDQFITHMLIGEMFTITDVYNECKKCYRENFRHFLIKMLGCISNCQEILELDPELYLMKAIYCSSKHQIIGLIESGKMDFEVIRHRVLSEKVFLWKNVVKGLGEEIIKWQ